MTVQYPITPAQRQRCAIHNVWKRKGKCEPCMLAEDRRKRAALLEEGIVQPKIKIGKL